MKRSAIYVAFLLMTTLLPTHAIAQDKPRPDTEAKKEVIATPIKLQIVFTEFDGDKKIKSLPYTIYYSASHAEMLQAGFTEPEPTYVALPTSEDLNLAPPLDGPDVFSSEYFRSFFLARLRTGPMVLTGISSWVLISS